MRCRARGLKSVRQSKRILISHANRGNLEVEHIGPGFWGPPASRTLRGDKVHDLLARRTFLQTISLLGAHTALSRLAPAWAFQRAGQLTQLSGPDVDLIVRKQRIEIAGGWGTAITVNESLPAPLLRFREGEEVTIRVRNDIEDASASIHWHGILVPWNMDGVPGVSFDGIQPGQTFTYRFKLRQSGTYWYHSHSGFQEQSGLYGPLIIDPAEAEPNAYDREYVVLLSDWTFEDPDRLFAKIKKQANYFNFQRRTAGGFFRDIANRGLGATIRDRLMWGRMRMDPTDILDVTGATYTYLVNGLSPGLNWTGLFTPGERVRLRFINSGAMTIFDVRIPGLKMTVIEADGQDVEPVETDEFRMGAAETMDVIVQPKDAKAYTIFAEAMDRSGYAAGTLAPHPGMRAAVPALRERPLRTMSDMGMAHGNGHGGAHAGAKAGTPGAHAGPAGAAQDAAKRGAGAMDSHRGHGEQQQSGADGRAASGAHAGHASQAKDAPKGTAGDPHAGHGAQPRTDAPEAHAAHRGSSPMPEPVMHGPDHHGPGNAMVAEMSKPRVGEPGTGLEEMPWKVLVYTDLRRLKPDDPPLEPDHEIELHLTGNMERQMWSINGKKFSEDPTPIPIELGKRTRFVLVNDTMMDHPMHIHGMFMILENGHGAQRPYKHTILVKAGERLAFDVKPDESGPFAFHCHLLFHMELGMFRVVSVSGEPKRKHT